MIILIGAEKGGVGKTTIATNLCVALAHRGRDVLLLDADRQSSAASWVAERQLRAPEMPKVNCAQAFGKQLYGTIRDMAQRYEDVVIDAGGRDSVELRTAMTVAEVMYSPLRASAVDLWTVEHVDELVGLARALNPTLKAYALITMAPNNPRIMEAAAATDMLTTENFSNLALATSRLHDRKPYRDAMCQGRGVVELADPKAKAEIETLIEEIMR